jgi:hypothetical protein
MVAGVTSGKEFFAALKSTPCDAIDKGDRWGAALMKYALNHEQLPSGHKKGGKVRQLVEIAHDCSGSAVWLFAVAGKLPSRSSYRRDSAESGPAVGNSLDYSGQHQTDCGGRLRKPASEASAVGREGTSNVPVSANKRRWSMPWMSAFRPVLPFHRASLRSAMDRLAAVQP